MNILTIFVLNKNYSKYSLNVCSYILQHHIPMANLPRNMQIRMGRMMFHRPPTYEVRYPFLPFLLWKINFNFKLLEKG